MARKTPSRLELRKQTEAAEKRGASAEKETKKKTTRKKATTPRAKRTTAPTRKRVVWAIFSGSMKEEARFPYAERAQAEEKLEQLRAKGKKMYFIQPVKEDMSDGAATAPAKAKAKAAPKPVKKVEEEEE